MNHADTLKTASCVFLQSLLGNSISEHKYFREMSKREIYLRVNYTFTIFAKSKK